MVLGSFVLHLNPTSSTFLSYTSLTTFSLSLSPFPCHYFEKGSWYVGMRVCVCVCMCRIMFPSPLFWCGCTIVSSLPLSTYLSGLLASTFFFVMTSSITHAMYNQCLPNPNPNSNPNLNFDVPLLRRPPILNAYNIYVQICTT